MRHIRATANQHGSTFQITPYIQKFIDHATSHRRRVLDIGAAFGVTSLPCLAADCEVVAMDLEKSHLNTIANNAPPSQRQNLTLVEGRFPQDTDKIQGKFDTILCSRILHFLTPEELQQASKFLYDSLNPGGKLFTLNFTPYLKFHSGVIPLYEARVKNHDPYPGYFPDATPYVMEQGKLPKTLHLLDIEVTTKILTDQKFKILESFYEAFPPEFDDGTFCYDGREQACVTAVR